VKPLEERLRHNQLPHLTSVLVVGASGSVGTTVLKEMKEVGFDRKMNIIVGLHQTKLPADIYEWTQHAFARTMPLNFEQPSSLDMRGIDALFIIPSNDVNRVQHVKNCVQSAVKHSVKYILLISSLGAEKEETDWTRDFRKMEAIVEDSNIPCTFLRINWLIDNLFLQTQNIREENAICLPIQPNCRFSPLSVSDIAKACCSILTCPESHLNIAYDLTGPASITPEQLAQEASTGLGRQIRFRQISHDEAVRMKVRCGFDERLAIALTDYFLLVTSPNHEYSRLNTEEFFHALTGEKGLFPSQWFHIHRDEFAPIEKIGTREVGTGTPIGGGTRTHGAGDEVCGACGISRQTTNALVELVDAMATSFEDWFRRRSERMPREEQHVRKIANLRKSLQQARATLPLPQIQVQGQEQRPYETGQQIQKPFSTQSEYSGGHSLARQHSFPGQQRQQTEQFPHRSYTGRELGGEQGRTGQTGYGQQTQGYGQGIAGGYTQQSSARYQPGMQQEQSGVQSLGSQIGERGRSMEARGGVGAGEPYGYGYRSRIGF